MNLPFLITLPHCSSRVPEHIRADFALNEKAVHQSEDHGSFEVFGSLPARAVKAEYSRLVVDLNRAPVNSGPKGVVAETDYHGRQIYKTGRYPDEAGILTLINSYYMPFHEKIAAAFSAGGIRCLFDCHSLSGTGPPDAPDAGKRRKEITLSNCGDESGHIDPEKGGISCPADLVTGVKEIFEASGFSVSINDPYRGGHITWHYGMKYARQNKYAMQVELNQDLVMAPGDTRINPEKTKETERRIKKIFKEIASRLF